MGQSASSSAAPGAGRVLRFGEAHAASTFDGVASGPPGSGGQRPRAGSRRGSLSFSANPAQEARSRGTAVLGVFVDHTRTRALPRGQVIVATPQWLDVYNADSGDRRLRLPAAHPITCMDARNDTLAGHVVGVGTTNGDVVLFRAADLAELCTFHTNGTRDNDDEDENDSDSDVETGGGTALGSAVELGAVGGTTGAHGSVDSGVAAAVTALTLAGRNTVFAGHSDGVVRAFRIDSGDLFQTYTPPTRRQMAATAFDDARPADASGEAKTSGAHGEAEEQASFADIQAGRIVSSVAVLTAGATALVVVGHQSGTVHFYGLKTGAWESTCKAPSQLSRVIACSALGCVLTAHNGHNAVGVWDVEEEEVAVLDFSAEAVALDRPRTSTITAVAWDADRSSLMCAYDDGAVMVRAVGKHGNGGQVSMKLRRVCRPVPPSASTAVAAAAKATTIETLWYSTVDDDLYTGDSAGVTRIITSVTGVPYEETSTAARAARAAREAQHESKKRGEVADSGAGAGAGVGAGAGAALADSLVHVTWDGGEFYVNKVGCRLTGVRLQLGDRTVEPLSSQATEGFGAPFGGRVPHSASALSPDWQRCAGEATGAAGETASRYGVSGAAAWSVVADAPGTVTLEVTYPETEAISSIRRTFTGRGASVLVATDVTTRRGVTIPVGVDVPLCMPAEPAAAAVLATPDFEFGAVHPDVEAQATARAAAPLIQPSPGASFTTLSSVPRRVAAGPGSHVGGADVRVDMSALPVAASVAATGPSSDTAARVACVDARLQLCAVADGSFAVVDTVAGHKVRLTWDADVFGSLLLHLHTGDAGKPSFLVATPAASAFDLGAAISGADNPLSARGVATTVSIEAGETATLAYTLEVTETSESQ